MFNSIKKCENGLFEFDYRPKILVAIAGDQITIGFQNAFGYSSSAEYTRMMCWAHVHTNCEEHTLSITDINIKLSILNDIGLLQVMPSPKMLDHATKLFFEKWNKSSLACVITFLAYFKKTLIDSVNHGWDEGRQIKYHRQTMV